MGESSEIFEEDFLFMFFRLSHGDNMDFVFCFSMCDYHDRNVTQTYCNPSLFPVIKSSILKCKSWSSEDLACIGKINAVLIDICFSLRFMPCELHGIIIHIFMHISRCFLCGLLGRGL